MSAVRLIWSRDVPCPVCGADVGDPCRTLKSKRTTDVHGARAVAFYAAKRQSGGAA